MKHKYDAVIFDLDGTLIDSMWVWEKIDEEFLAVYGHEVPQNIDEELKGKSFTETALYFKERFNLPISVEEIKVIWNDMALEFYKTRVPLKEGVKTFLEELEQKGIKMGIATSNSIEVTESVLEALDVRKYFSKIYTSCQVGRGKEFPDIYLKVAEELGVKPERCIVFEDIPDAIKTVKKAGMSVCGIYDRQPENIEQEMKIHADYFINDYSEVERCFIS